MRKEIILTGIALQQVRLIEAMINADVARNTAQIKEQAKPLLNALAMELGCPDQAWTFSAKGPDSVLYWEVPDIAPEQPDIQPATA